THPCCIIFCVRDGKTLIRDHDGIKLPDFSAALSEAPAPMRELAIEALRQAQAANRLEVEINDGSGRTPDVVTFGDVADGDEP
ncbi:MAG: DUF6894 family protein, partial [Rhizomicrobium sp.]